MAKKVKTPLSEKTKFPSKLYLCLCIDALLKLRTGDEAVDKRIVELAEPLLEEWLEGKEFLA
jgi:hypothetical protein